MLKAKLIVPQFTSYPSQLIACSHLSIVLHCFYLKTKILNRINQYLNIQILYVSLPALFPSPPKLFSFSLYNLPWSWDLLTWYSFCLESFLQNTILCSVPTSHTLRLSLNAIFQKRFSKDFSCIFLWNPKLILAQFVALNYCHSIHIFVLVIY